MIRTCLFDMGNVLVFFSHDRMCQQLGQLCGLTGPEMRHLLIDSGVQWDYERGRLNTVQFQDWFQTATGCQITLPELNRAGADIFWLNEPIVPVLDRLKELGIRLVLLSNTCQTHFDWIWKHFDVLQRFDAHVTSCAVRAVKPEPEIYHAVLDQIGCPVKECFYTDDISQYVEAGRSHGFSAEVFTDVPNLIQHLHERGIDIL
ncbi:MAG: HAD family phosphatase [Planctomycetia bacterium]|nr:HAD family phosphatase [Planctomycetia bacterium]